MLTQNFSKIFLPLLRLSDDIPSFSCFRTFSFELNKRRDCIEDALKDDPLILCDIIVVVGHKIYAFAIQSSSQDLSTVSYSAAVVIRLIKLLLPLCDHPRKTSLCRTVKLLCRGSGGLNDLALDQICTTLREKGYSAPESSGNSSNDKSSNTLQPLRMDTDPNIFTRITSPLLETSVSSPTSSSVMNMHTVNDNTNCTQAQVEAIAFADGVNTESREAFMISCRKAAASCDLAGGLLEMCAQLPSLMSGEIELSGNEELLEVLWTLWSQLPGFGPKAAQYIDLLGYCLLRTESPVVEDRRREYMQGALELLRHQNEIIAQHPNAHIYQSLQGLVLLDGYYLEQEPCLVCNDQEQAYSLAKLNDIKSETKCTHTTQFYQLDGKYSVQRVTVKLSEVKRNKMVRTVNVYYNTRSRTTMADLKNRKSLWQHAKRVQLAENQTEVRVDFPIPIVACFLIFEFTDFYEQLSGSETHQCPRCSTPVPAQPGICGQCGESVYQCAKCRHIFYDQRDAFLCTNCGHSKYTKLDYSLLCRPSCSVDPIDSEDDRRRAVTSINALLEQADVKHRKLRAQKNAIEATLGRLGERSTSSGGLSLESSVKPAALKQSGTAGMLSALACVNGGIQALAKYYCSEAKDTFAELTRLSHQVLANRRELVVHDQQQLELAREFTRQSSLADAHTTGSSGGLTAVPRSSSFLSEARGAARCFGCAAATVEQCIVLLRALSTRRQFRELLCRQGLVSMLLEHNLLDCFCQVVAGIATDVNGDKLKDLIVDRGILQLGTEYLLQRAADQSKSVWTEFLSLPALPFMLRMLAGVCAAHPRSARLLAATDNLLPRVQRLELTSSAEGIGSLAENLMDALRKTPDVAQRVEEIRQRSRAERKKMALANRQRQLNKIGMNVNPKGQVQVQDSGAGSLKLEELKEENGLVCCICREGYKNQPTKVLGVYTFSKRCHADDMEAKPRKTVAYCTVSAFTVIHVECHVAAVRSVRSRDEWESAQLQNGNVRCNGLLPLCGPGTQELGFQSALARHNNYLQEAAQLNVTPTYTLMLHDLKLLLIRFAEARGFSEDTLGGGRQSNLQLVPYLLHLALHMLQHTRQTSRETAALQSWFDTPRGPAWVESAWEIDGVYYRTLLSLLLWPTARWMQRRVHILRRLLVSAQARRGLPGTTLKTRQLQQPFTHVYRPACIFFALVNHLSTDTFKRVSTTGSGSAGDAGWTEALAEYIRHHDRGMLDSAERALKLYQESLLLCDSFPEFCDIMGLLEEIPNPEEFLTECFAEL